MGVFYLKYRDTRPILEVSLLDPDGTAHDLTGSTSWKLNILLSSGALVTRDMVKVGPDADGVLSYTWLAADWTGGLIVGPTLPLLPGQYEHRMEYEVIGPGGARLTFPNGGETPEQSYDILRIWADIS